MAATYNGGELGVLATAKQTCERAHFFSGRPYSQTFLVDFSGACLLWILMMACMIQACVVFLQDGRIS
eukprot:scaffold630_cov399-Prasinococcus_capsulatus_cf.AAC.33